MFFQVLAFSTLSADSLIDWMEPSSTIEKTIYFKYLWADGTGPRRRRGSERGTAGRPSREPKPKPTEWRPSAPPIDGGGDEGTTASHAAWQENRLLEQQIGMSKRSPARAGRKSLTEGIPQPESVHSARKPFPESVSIEYQPVGHRSSMQVEPDINSQQTERSRV